MTGDPDITVEHISLLNRLNTEHNFGININSS